MPVGEPRQHLSEPRHCTIFSKYVTLYCAYVYWKCICACICILAVTQIFCFSDCLIENRPYSLSVDGSNDTGVEKLNPLTVKIFDVNRQQVSTQLLDMCTTSGRGCGTASAIFQKIDSNLNIPWENCVGFGVDNTSVNIGRHHSIKTQVQQRLESCYFMGCPCHLVHNIASHASEALHKESGVDVEDGCVDVSYWFNKSTKRKGILQEFCNFCNSS